MSTTDNCCTLVPYFNVPDEHLDQFKGLCEQFVEKTGQEEKGLRWIARAVEMEPEDPVVVWNAACAYSVAGNYENAFDCLERAIALGIANRRWLENDADMDPIRSTPRFQKLLDAMAPPK